MRSAVNSTFIDAAPYFKAVNPGIPSALRIPSHKLVVKGAFAGWSLYKTAGKRKQGWSYGRIAGDWLGGRVIAKAMKPIKQRVEKAHVSATRRDHDWRRKNGIGGRTWITRPGRYRMVIVYHDANRAGKHIDIHVDRFSLVYRVKPELEAQLKLNRDGYLTEDSRKAIIKAVQEEIGKEGGAFLAQNIDHTKSNARASWVNGDINGTKYGDGLTRQIVSESEVAIFKAHHNGPIEMYAPVLNSDRPVYFFRPFHPSKTGKAPIIAMGVMNHHPPKFDDRLHLKMVKPAETDRKLVNADMSTATAKYDGASCYFVIKKDGTTVWSPRTSKRTSAQIEYTHKINGIASATSDTGTVVGMGELLFIDTVTGEYVPAATTGGFLNSNGLVDERYKPQIRIYRIDKWGRTKTTDLPFWENRKLQTKAAKLNKNLEVVELMDPDIAEAKGFEGYVVAPEGGSVVDGYKVKWADDAEDWTIVKVAFKPGEKGGVAGKVHCINPADKPQNLGPGQVGNQELTRHMMANPEMYEGRVIKVQSNRGHSGRAAKVVDFHLDKGVAV